MSDEKGSGHTLFCISYFLKLLYTTLAMKRKSGVADGRIEDGD